MAEDTLDKVLNNLSKEQLVELSIYTFNFLFDRVEKTEAAMKQEVVSENGLAPESKQHPSYHMATGTHLTSIALLKQLIEKVNGFKNNKPT